MPIYEYRCGSCGHELEAMQKFSDPVLTQCPACSTDTLVKLVSAAGFQLKGGGWYATDFKGGAKGGGNGKEGGGNGKAEPAKAEGGDKASKDDTAPAKPAGCGTGCACH